MIGINLVFDRLKQQVNFDDNLNVVINFDSIHSKQTIADVLELIEARSILKLDSQVYCVRLDSLNYSKLSNLSTVNSVLLTQPLDY